MLYSMRASERIPSVPIRDSLIDLSSRRGRGNKEDTFGEPRAIIMFNASPSLIGVNAPAGHDEVTRIIR